MNTAGPSGEAPKPSGWPLWVTIAGTVIAVGFFSGTRSPKEPVRMGGAPALHGPAQAAPVPAYRQVGDARRGPNAALYTHAPDELRADLPDVLGPVPLGDRARAREARSSRRAYEGAPPIIPHQIDQRGVPGCLACHGQGAVVAGKVARAISHEPYASCVQCHVVAADPRPLGSPRSTDPANGFVGLAAAGPGARAWPGAPPALPHATWMRSQCKSCHGVAGLPGLRSSHPWRASCTQCHPPQAALERRFPRTPQPHP